MGFEERELSDDMSLKKSRYFITELRLLRKGSIRLYIQSLPEPCQPGTRIKFMASLSYDKVKPQ